MKPVIVTLAGGEELALQFTMDIWERLEEEGFDLEEMPEKLARKGRLRVVAKIAGILSGRDPEWIWGRMKPGHVKILSQAIVEAVNRGMSMETESEDADAEVDVTLQELEKNSTKDA